MKIIKTGSFILVQDFNFNDVSHLCELEEEINKKLLPDEEIVSSVQGSKTPGTVTDNFLLVVQKKF